MEGEATVIWFLILAIAGIAHLVRKGIEKLTSGEKGRKINLSRAVHRHMKKYLDRRDDREEPPEPARLAVDPDRGRAPRLRSRTPLVEPVPRAGPESTRRREETPAPFREPLRRSLREPRQRTVPPPLPVQEAEFRMDRRELRKAVVLAEILGPPMALRKDYRLF